MILVGGENNTPQETLHLLFHLHPFHTHLAVVLKVWATNQQVSIFWEFVRCAHFGPHPGPTKPETLGVGPSSLCFNRSSGDSDVC